ncbi:hypothetical protein PFLU4_54030 [Pseudomonas fluorescens]|nr:hypothetical protein PFLU4_54030 [Pseudomonas fluorescens]
MPNSRSQFSVGAGLAAQSREAFQQFAVACTKSRHAAVVFGIQARAVGQYQANAGQGVIGVLRCAAAHAAGVVGDDAADFAGVDRRRIWADLAPERRQPGVGLGADHAGLQTDLRALFTNLAPVPVIPEHNQHRVADGLPGQAGAGGAERDWNLVALGQFQQGNHFIFGFDAYHQFRNQPIETGVGAEGQSRQRIVETAFLRDQLLDVV